MEKSRSWLTLAGSVWIASAIFAHAQNCNPPPSGLIHWWRAEGNGFDTVALGDGVLVGGVQFTAGEVGSGFLISGSGDDYIALPQNLFPVPVSGESNAPFSFEVWFQTSASGVILGQQDQPPFNSDLGGYVPALYVGTNGLFYAEMFWATAPQLISMATVNDGKFHHAVVTYDGAVETLYLDATNIGSTPLTQEGYASTYYYELGTGMTGGWDATTGQWFPFTGVIDEASVYNRALTPIEVATLFNAGSAGKCAPPEPGLVLRHRYSFDGPPGSHLVTDSIRGANGVLVFGSQNAPYTNGTPDGSGFSGNGILDLQGTNGCVLLPPRPVSVLSNFTIEAWLTWNGAATSAWQRVFDFGLSERGTNAMGLGTNYVIFTPAQGGTDLPGFEETTVNPFGTNVDPEALVLAPSQPFPIGQEVYVAITYDPGGGSARLYFNGVLAAAASGVFNPTSRLTDYSSWLGRSQWDRDPYFNGSYDEFRIWQGILSDQDIASHYAAGPNQQFVAFRPTLLLTQLGGNLVLSWRSDGTAQLQSTPRLSPATWLDVTNGVSLSNSTYSVVLPATAASAFYRLRQ
ncbi:MAG TPA: LamG domain-containing protein [Verrucomicrobiae bacterium]|nr:LamG domain-containing protein [Verrucomicrobiae bacterium]